MIVLGVTTAVGGGAIRDVILGIAPPASPESNLYTGSDNYIVCGLSDLVSEKRTSAGA